MTRTRKPRAGVGRLRKRSDFLAVRRGARRHGRYFTLDILDRGNAAGPPRVGFTVTRRQGNAVERNRIRRRLRELMRFGAWFAMLAGHDYVLTARREALTAPFPALARELAARLAAPERRRGAPRRDRIQR